MTLEDPIQQFLSGSPYAVVGASQDREKYGNKVLRAYLQNKMVAYPINPKSTSIEGVKSYADLGDLPSVPHGISIITPPAVSTKIVKRAIELGIKHIWLQPGAEHEDAISAADEAGVNLIAGGPCLLVALRFRDE